MPTPRVISTARRSAVFAAAKRRRAIRNRRPPRILYPHTTERTYQRILLAVIHELRELVGRLVLPRVEQLQVEAFAMRPDAADVRLDDLVGDVRTLLDLLLAGLRPALDRARDEIRPVAEEAAAWATRQEARVFVAFDLETFFRQPWLSELIESFQAENLSLVTRLSEETVSKVGEIILRDFRKGRDHRDIARDLRDQLDLSANRAKLIARDQVSSLNGEIHRLTQTEMGVSEYIWRTALDDRVRPSHEVKEGQRFRWDDPPDTGHPGEDINCRCTAEPVLDEIIEETNRILAGVGAP